MKVWRTRGTLFVEGLKDPSSQQEVRLKFLGDMFVCDAIEGGFNLSKESAKLFISDGNGHYAQHPVDRLFVENLLPEIGKVALEQGIELVW